MSKPKKSVFNNPYKIDNEKANEVRGLSNTELVARAALEYKNWLAAVSAKKNDGTLLDTKERIKELKQEINNDPRVVDLAEQLKKLKEELVEEEQAKLEEEHKNFAQPHNEDIKAFKGVFQVAMDEIARRRESGAIKAS